MNSILIFSNISFIFLIFMASSAPFYFSKKDKISIIDIGTGFIILILLSNLLYWTNINKDLCVLMLILSLVLFMTLSIKKSKYYLFSLDSARFIFAYFFLLIFYSMGNSFRYKQYVNPDPMGYAAVTSSLNQFESFPNLLKNWALETGQSFNFNFDWNAPMPLVPNAWSVPNEALKYAADVIYFQRTGINSFISMFGHKFDTYAFYPYIWNSIGVLAISLMIVLFLNVNYQLLKGIVKESNTRGSKVKKKILSLITDKNLLFIFILLMFSSSIGIQVFLMEGFIPHLISFVIIVLFGSILIDINSDIENKFKICASVILFLSMHIVYLQMILILYAMLGFYLFYFLIKNWRYIKLVSYAKIALVAIPIAFIEYNLPGVNYLVKQIGDTSGHGAVHLGTINLNDAFGLFSKKISLGTPTPGLSSIIYSDTKIQISTQHWGYLPISNSFFVILLSYLFFLILCLYSLYKFKSNWKLFSVILTSIFLIITNFYYILTHTYFATTSIFISDYVWLRLSMVLIIMLYCFIPAIFFYIIKEFNSFVLSSLLIISLLIGCFNSIIFIRSYSNFNKEFTISKKCPDFISENSIKKIVITKDNSTFYNTPLSLFLCNSKVKSLSDPYPTKQKVSKGTAVYVFTYLNETNNWGYMKFGNFLDSEIITTPCDISCIANNKNFEVSSDSNKVYFLK